MGVEEGGGLAPEVEKGFVEPLRLETESGGPTELESRFGREGVIVAATIDLTNNSVRGVNPIDIALNTGIEDLYADEVGRVLRKHGLHKTESGLYIWQEKPLSEWMMKQGVEEQEIGLLVTQHLINRVGRIDFGLGDPPDIPEDPNEDMYLDTAVAEPEEPEDDSFWD